MRASELQFTSAQILQLFELLNEELAREGVAAELSRVGGAVMYLALNASVDTREKDAAFQPTAAVRQAAKRVSMQAGVPDTWLNDAVKGWLSPRGTYDAFLQRSHLQVFVAQPAYLLAMKCAAMRLGEEFRDLDDVRFLLRYLNITSFADAIAVITQYFDEAQLPPKTFLALEELLSAP